MTLLIFNSLVNNIRKFNSDRNPLRWFFTFRNFSINFSCSHFDSFNKNCSLNNKKKMCQSHQIKISKIYCNILSFSRVIWRFLSKHTTLFAKLIPFSLEKKQFQTFPFSLFFIFWIWLMKTSKSNEENKTEIRRTWSNKSQFDDGNFLNKLHWLIVYCMPFVEIDFTNVQKRYRMELHNENWLLQI